MKNLLVTYIKLLKESDDIEEEEKLEEFSAVGGGAVGGYTAPYVRPFRKAPKKSKKKR